MRRLMLSCLAVCSLGLAAPAAQALADAPPVSQMRVALDSNAVAPDFSWTSAATAAATATASHENVVILQSWETDELHALKAANPNVKVLMYENTSSASTSASASGLYSTGVSYQQANANGWLLKNTSGQPFTFSGENWLYATDIGSAAYQNAWAQNVVSELKSQPWDGVFMDDVNPTIAYHYSVGAVAKYPSDAAYSAAMGSFVANVGPQIQAAGKLAIANIGSWAGYGSTVDPWLNSLSGAMDEEFLKWGATSGSGYADAGTWKTQLGEIALCQSEGKLFLGVTHSSGDDEQAALYGYATELLAGNGNASFTLAPDYHSETWFPEYGYAIGQPTGAYSVAANGVYQRAFANGLALVNPTSSTQTVALNGTYTGSGLSHVSSVTMAPQSGLVLVPDAGTTASAPAPVSTTPVSSTPAPTAPATPAPTAPATPSSSTPTTGASSTTAPTTTTSATPAATTATTTTATSTTPTTTATSTPTAAPTSTAAATKAAKRHQYWLHHHSVAKRAHSRRHAVRAHRSGASSK